MSQEWQDYLWSECAASVVLLLIGASICLTIICNLWFSAPKPTGKRPSLLPLQGTACGGFLLLWLCAGMCVGRGMYAFDWTYSSIERMQPDIALVSDNIAQLQPGFMNTAIWMT